MASFGRSRTVEEAEECAGWLNGTRDVFRDKKTRVALSGGYTSQYRQDRVMHERYFANMSGRGVYLDVAANHYKRISNTYFFDVCLGWQGLCLEPNPIYHDGLRAHRTCELLPTCASDRAEAISLTMPTDQWLGGLGGVGGGGLNKYPKYRHSPSVVRNMTCVRVGDELVRRGIVHVDLFSLDVEGFEESVLRGIDFCLVRITHVLCEAGCAGVLRPLGYEEVPLPGVGGGEDRLWRLQGREPIGCAAASEQHGAGSMPGRRIPHRPEESDKYLLALARNISSRLAPDWQLVRHSPSRIIFDVDRHVSLGCDGRGYSNRVSDADPSAADDNISVIGCVVNARSTGGMNWRWAGSGQIGHAAQILLRCWSFISHFNEDVAIRNSTRLLIAKNAPRDYLPTRFSGELMRAMGLRTFQTLPRPSVSYPSLGGRVGCVKLWAVPSRSIYPGSSSIFFVKPHDVWRLVSAVTGRPIAAGHGRHGGLLAGESHAGPSAGLRLGYLARGASRMGEDETREWPHAAALFEALRSSPVRGIGHGSPFYLHNISLAEQAELVRAHDIIVTTHGSHGVSLAFVKPCTVLILLLQSTFLVTEFAELAAQAGARTFFLHPGHNVTANAEATFILSRNLNLAWSGRNAHDYHRLGVTDVRAALHRAVDTHRRCVAGNEPPVGWDGIPTMGGGAYFDARRRNGPDRCFSCYGSAQNCCNSTAAIETYVSGASGCRQCLPLFRNLTDAAVCAAASQLKVLCKIPTNLQLNL